MNKHFPVRLGPAEQTLIEQLDLVGATAEADRLRTVGLPTRRVESYHYTDLKMLLRQVPSLAGDQPAEGVPPLAIEDAFRLVLTGNAVEPQGAAPIGVTAGMSDGGVLTERDDVVVRLNTALARRNLNLTLSGVVDRPVYIDRRLMGAAGHATTGAQVFLADGGKVTIIETVSGSSAAHLGNHASYLAVGKGAELTHIVVDMTPRPSTHLMSIEYVLAENAKLRSLVIHAGARLARTNIFARVAGSGAHGDFAGLNLVEEGQHVDITLDLNHAVPNTTSQEIYKSVARGRSRAVFQGKIVVARDAQKTDAKMMTQGLMLSDEAEIFAKPELEIYADDVVCGHGSTTGQLNEDHLFYLMSRGIPRADAETILVRAFLAELLDPFVGQPVHGALEGLIENWLGQGVS